MAKYIPTKRALIDLSEIWEYTFAEWSGEQADKYYFELLEICQTLANNSTLGKFYN